jgi:hypothetical protein
MDMRKCRKSREKEEGGNEDEWKYSMFGGGAVGGRGGRVVKELSISKKWFGNFLWAKTWVAGIVCNQWSMLTFYAVSRGPFMDEVLQLFLLIICCSYLINDNYFSDIVFSYLNRLRNNTKTLRYLLN